MNDVTAEHEARGHEGQSDPAQAPPGGQGLVGLGLRLGRGGRPPQRHGAGGQQQHQQPVGDRPRLALPGQPDVGLHEQRVAQQPDDAAQVAGPVEEVGISRGGVGRRGQPALEQRRGGGDHEERQAHRYRQQAQEREHRRVARPEVLGHGDRQHHDGDQHQRQVDGGLAPRAQPARARVRVQVGQQERGLEEDQRRVPHRRGAPEAGQHELGEHRLDQEDQPRARARLLCRTGSPLGWGDRNSRKDPQHYEQTGPFHGLCRGYRAIRPHPGGLWLDHGHRRRTGSQDGKRGAGPQGDHQRQREVSRRDRGQGRRHR